jgi:hypothetical protein
MRWVRTWLPVGIITAGVAVIAVTGASETGLEGGGMLIAAGLSVWLLNWFYRLGVRGDRERDSEDRARAFFDEHGFWPDDDAQAPAAEERQDPSPPERSAPPHRTASPSHWPPSRGHGPSRRP